MNIHRFFSWILYFILRLIRRMLELPLIIFYVIPILVIVIYFQENQMGTVSGTLLAMLFLGNIPFSTEGATEINGFRELGVAVMSWLIIFELLSEVLEWMYKRRKKKFPGAKIAAWSLAIVYVGAGLSIAYTRHEGPLSTYLWFLAVLYGLGFLVLKLYQFLESGFHLRKN